MSSALEALVAAVLDRKTFEEAEVRTCLEAALACTVGSDAEIESINAVLTRLAAALFDSGSIDLGFETISLAGSIALTALEQRRASVSGVLYPARWLHLRGMSHDGASLLAPAMNVVQEQVQEVTISLARLASAFGDMLREVGELDGADLALRQGIEASVLAPQGDPLLHSDLLNNLGLVLIEKGDLAGAADCLLQSLRLATEHQGDSSSIAITASNLAGIELRLAQRAGPLELGNGYINAEVDRHLRQSQHYIADAHAIFEALLPDSTRDYAISLLRATVLAELRGDEADQEMFSRKALALVEDAGVGGSLLGEALFSRTTSLLRQGRAGEVVEILSPWLDRGIESQGGGEWPDAMVSLAEAAAAVGNAALVHRACQAVIALDDRLLDRQLVSVSEAEARHLFQPVSMRARKILGCGLSTCVDDTCPEWLYGFTLRRKGILSERLGSRWIQGWRLEGASRGLVDEFRARRFEATLLDLDGADVGFIRDARRRRDEADRRAGRVETQVLRAIGRDAQAIERVTLEDVRAGLGPDTVLLDFATAIGPEGSNRYVVFLVRNAGPLRFRVLGPTDVMDARIEDLAKLLDRPARDAASEPAWQDEVQEMSSLLFGVDQTLEANIRVAPTGLWYWVPFSLLFNARASPLIDEHVVSMVPSARWIGQRSRRSAVSARSGDESRSPPVVLCDPDFDHAFDDDTPFFLSKRYERLHHAALEAREVGSILGVDPIVFRHATREALLGLHRPVVLHIATHGAFLQAISSRQEMSEPRVTVLSKVGNVVVEEEGPGDFMSAANAAAPDDARERHRARVRWLQEIGPADPLSRSVLLLAGVNAWLAGVVTPQEIGTGMLTAGELAMLDLISTELVVLSACETAIGPIDYGDGSLLGLRSATLLAGAASCVAALWRVDDAATTHMMVNFYRALRSGCTRAQALRASQQAVRSHHPHPHYWAGWVVDGEDCAMQCQGSTAGNDS